MTHQFQFTAIWIAKRLVLVTVTLLLANVVAAQTARRAPGAAPEE